MQHDDSELEETLRRYRPRGPAADLRTRVLRAASGTDKNRDASYFLSAWLFRGAVAAVLLISLGLNRAAQQINRSIAAGIGTGPVKWTPEAEQAAQLVGGGELGRQYIAMCLLGGGADETQEATR